MSAAQLALPFPAPEIQPGDRVWWTHGLTYLVATYQHGGKIRPESGEMVTVAAIGQDTDPYSGMYQSSRTIRVYSHEEGREYSVAERWLSKDPSVPCEAVMQAYGVGA